MDGVDAALLETDGEHNVRPLESRFRAYTAKERSLIAAALGKWPEDEGLEAAKEVVEAAHLEVIGKFEAVDLVGFHGQTLTHDPAGGRTHQLGDGASIARHCGLPVAWDFRSADMKAGGQGAPLAPFYHHALVRSAGCTSPVAVLNLGGVGNVTVVDPRIETPEAEGALLAFDTGPANALVDDLMMAREGLSCDRDGRAAAAGQADQRIVRAALGHPFFKEPPPKSLDRGAFDHVLGAVSGLETQDAAATLTALTAASVAAGAALLTNVPKLWYVTGGGRRNPVMMTAMAEALSGTVTPIEEIGFDGDMLEAQAFAWLAERVRRGLVISGPGSTGAPQPALGGQLSMP